MPPDSRPFSLGRLILVRHGESEGNRDRTFTHSPAVPLTERGREQARRAAAVIAAQFAPVGVVGSPYTRARQTAEIIAAILALPLAIEEAFREQSLGSLAGQSYDVVAQDPAFDPACRWAWRPPGGESLEDVQRRVVPALDRLMAAHAGRDVVMVSHGGVMFALWAHAIGSWELAQVTGNAGIVVVEHAGGRCQPPRFVDSGGAGTDVATLSSAG
jgi:probable phosphoglycerate mutase